MNDKQPTWVETEAIVEKRWAEYYEKHGELMPLDYFVEHVHDEIFGE